MLKGYYTLANNSLAQNLIPTEFQKKGVGKLLLIDALSRSYEISKSIGSFAVVVDPIDEDTLCGVT